MEKESKDERQTNKKEQVDGMHKNAFRKNIGFLTAKRPGFHEAEARKKCEVKRSLAT